MRDYCTIPAEELTSAWIEMLRTTKLRQIKYRLTDGKGGCCALGLLYAEGLLVVPRGVNRVGVLRDYYPADFLQCVSAWNDTWNRTFSEIADLLEDYVAR